MKIVTDEEILVQKKDLISLLYDGNQMPQSIVETIFEGGYIVVDGNNKNDFVRFTLPSEINYLNNIKWILDYSSLKSLTDEELKRLEDVFVKRHAKVKEKYLAMPEEEGERKKFFAFQIRSAEYQLLTIEDFKEHKDDPIKVVNDSTPEATKKESGIKQFIKSIFKK